MESVFILLQWIPSNMVKMVDRRRRQQQQKRCPRTEIKFFRRVSVSHMRVYVCVCEWVCPFKLYDAQLDIVISAKCQSIYRLQYSQTFISRMACTYQTDWNNEANITAQSCAHTIYSWVWYGQKINIPCVSCRLGLIRLPGSPAHSHPITCNNISWP